MSNKGGGDDGREGGAARASRRDFLASAAAISAAAWGAGCGEERDSESPDAGPARRALPPPRPIGVHARAPVFAATWEWGVPACNQAARALGAGATLLDAIERGINVVELDPAVMTVGYGGVPDEDGIVELDAMIMEGSTLRAGAVAALREIATPISVARKVMEHTRHVMLAGEGALRFAVALGFERRDLLTEEARRELREWIARGRPGSFWTQRPPVPTPSHDTVGVVGADGRGEMACGVSTSGLWFKVQGRVGDSPLVGAGGYADAEVGAVAATGVGDEIIRVAGSYAVIEAMRRGLPPGAAAAEVLHRLVRRRPSVTESQAQVAFIALRRDGSLGAACLRPGFKMAVHREGVTGLVAVDPLVTS